VTINRVSSRWPARRFPRALRALGFFCLVAAQVSAVWVGYVRGRNDEQVEWLRQTAPVLLQTKCPREIPNHMRTPRT
jgi:hypothetical protein